MKVAVIGGGPAGLYFALLLKAARPMADIHVYERNRADDTFGFGVVFSDQTLDTFKANDLPSYEAIRRSFAYWDDIEIHFKDTVHRIGGNGFCGCSRRTLLLLLQDRARSLGVKMTFGVEIEDEASLGADLIVIADGLNSRIRERHREHFRTHVDMRPNKFSWMGSTRPFDAFNYFFRETEHGVFIAHCYQYEANASTWVLETTPDAWASAGLDRMDEGESARFLEGRVRKGAAGPSAHHQPLALALLPDAAQRALGEGQHGPHRRRQGDGAFLHRLGHQARHGGRHRTVQVVMATGSVPEALAHFEETRRNEVERTQHAADTSLVWFEEVGRFWDMDPTQFAFGLMTRSKAITYDNLMLRAPEFVAQVDGMMARDVAERGFARMPVETVAPMFQPFRLRDMALSNRVVVSPMCMYSAEDGMPGDFHLVHYGSRAMGGRGSSSPR